MYKNLKIESKNIVKITLKYEQKLDVEIWFFLDAKFKNSIISVSFLI